MSRNHSYSDLSNSDFLGFLIIDLLLKFKEVVNRSIKSFKRFFILYIIIIPLVIFFIILFGLIILPIFYLLTSIDLFYSKRQSVVLNKKFATSSNEEKMELYNNLRNQIKKFIEDKDRMKKHLENHIPIFHPIIKKIYLSGITRYGLIEKWDDEIYSKLEKVPIEDKIIFQKSLITFSEDWNETSMDVYDLQYGPLSI